MVLEIEGYVTDKTLVRHGLPAHGCYEESRGMVRYGDGGCAGGGYNNQCLEPVLYAQHSVNQALRKAHKKNWQYVF